MERGNEKILQNLHESISRFEPMTGPIHPERGEMTQCDESKTENAGSHCKGSLPLP